MAKKTMKRPAPKNIVPKKKGRPKSSAPKEAVPVVLTIRAKPEWTEWLDKLCRELSKTSGIPRIERTVAIDVALKTLAANVGVEDPPDRY